MTAQFHEEVIYEGQELTMASCPDLPVDHPRVSQLKDDQLDIKENIVFFSTACWRGYIGTWMVAQGRLYLVKLRGRYQLSGQEPLFADWFTGELRIPQGERLKYVHMGFESVYEKDLFLDVKEGVVIASRLVDNRGDTKSNLVDAG